MDAKTRQIFDPLTREFNYSKRRVKDLQENNYVHLPKAVSGQIEGELSMISQIIMKEFNDYKRETEKGEEKKGIEEEKRRNQKEDNLTDSERRGLN